MSTLPFPLGEHSYQIGKLSAMKQFHVVRRLAPAMATVGITVSQIKELRGVEDLTTLLGPVSGVLAGMRDEDADYVIFTCLGAVRRVQVDGRTAPIVVAGEQRLMFEDISMPQMLRLVFEVVRENMADFTRELGELSALPSSSAAPASTSKA